MSNDALPNSGEGTCPGAPAPCEGDQIWTDIDEIVSGSGADHLVAGVAGTWIDGGPGDDNLDANNLADVVVDNTSFTSTGTPGLVIDETAGTQVGNGNDTLTHDPGDMSFVGGEGDDTFIIDDSTSFQSFCGAGGDTDLVDASTTMIDRSEPGPRERFVRREPELWDDRCERHRLHDRERHRRCRG